MHSLYLLSVFLHILAAIIWVGGMFFLVLVIVPWLRQGDRARAATMMRDVGTRLRDIGWVCFAVLTVTGTFNLWVRGVRIASFTDPIWLDSSFGKSVVAKLTVFAVILASSAVHDFIIGPRATELVSADPRSPAAEALRRKASIMGRMNAVLALIAVAIAVTLVRGTPW